MPTTIDELLSASMSLSFKERAELAGKLLLSLEYPPESEVERLWLDEAERRLSAFRRGEVRTIPGEEVFRQAAADLS